MNNQEKQSIINYTNDALNQAVPNHLVSGLAMYIVLGIRPGGFLTAVLENDLKGAVSCGDVNSLSGLVDIVRYLYSYVPARCWGSPNKVEEWKGDPLYVNR